jgi:hypothetical protein
MCTGRPGYAVLFLTQALPIRAIRLLWQSRAIILTDTKEHKTTALRRDITRFFSLRRVPTMPEMESLDYERHGHFEPPICQY